MTPDECFDAMAKVLGYSNPQDIGYIQLLEDVTKLKEKKKKQNSTTQKMSAETFHDVQTDIEQVSEHLAQKFYKHYDDMDYDKMYIAKTVGPDLGRMIDHLMEENKKLKEELQEEKDGREHDVQQFQSVLEEKGQLEAEVEELKDFTHWENHPALKHKVVLDDDYYLEHVEDGELIDPETFSLLKDEKEHLDSLVDELQEENKQLKLERQRDTIDEARSARDKALSQVKKLEKKAKAWNIINHGADWGNLRDLCDEDMCKALIETGECDKEDFEGYCYEPQ